METLRNFAKQHGIQLNDYADKPKSPARGGNAPAKPAAAKRTAGGATVSDW
jgi:hypothetical protein